MWFLRGNKMQKIKNQGYVMLAVLLAIVIVAMLYMVDLTAMFGPIDKNRAYEERPWFEDKRLVEKEKLPIKQTGKGDKTLIYTETVLAGGVERKGEKRGDIEIIIEPNGLAQGHWQCAYEYADSKTSYTITANFAGNIDPTKTFEDPNGTNKKLLYFITKGQYEQIKIDADGKQWPNKETVYAVGWIDKDKSVKGKIFLMTADGGSAEYNWRTNAEKYK